MINNAISDHFDIFCVLRTILERPNKGYIIKRDESDLMSIVDWILQVKTSSPSGSLNRMSGFLKKLK